MMESTGMMGGKKENGPNAIGTPKGKMATGKGDFSKVRKSLAWNKAFFTDEGVLDSTELSRLSGLVSKPDESFLSRTHDVSMSSPFTSSQKIRSNTSRMHPIQETPGMGSQTRHRNKDRSPNGLFSDSNSVARGRPLIHRKQEKAPEGKTPCRNILRQPTANSQKRIANASVSNPTSKIPKLKGVNSSVPKPLKNSPQSSKTSKARQTLPPVTVHTNKQSARSTSLSENIKPSNSIKSIPNKSAKITAGQTPLKNILQTRTNSDLTLHPKPPRPKNLTPLCETTPNHKFITSSSGIEENVRQGLPVKSLAKPSALRKPSPSLGFFEGRKFPLDVGKTRTTEDVLSSVSGSTKEINTTNISSSSCTKLNMNCAIKSGTESRMLKRTMSHNSSADKNSKSRTENHEKLIVDDYINERDKKKNFGSLESIDSKKIGTKLHQQHILKPKSSSASNISEVKQCSIEQISSFSQASYEKKTIVDVEHCQSNCNVAVNEVSTSSRGNRPDHEMLIGNDYSNDQTNKLVQGLSKPIINIKHIDSVKSEYTEPVLLEDVQLRSSLSEIQRCSIERTNSLGQANIEEHTTVVAEYCQPSSDILVNGISVSSGGINPDHGLTSELKDEVFPEKDSCSFTFHNLDVTHAIVSESEEHQDSGLMCKQTCNILVPKEDEVDLHSSIADESCILSSNMDLAYCRGDHELKKKAHTADEISVIRNDNSTNICKKKCASLQCHLNPEPFTDEWIAAREAFGEDILKMKGGAVQNSPTEKSPPEPSPWSPVKRKNQDVGPYDCTKYTKYT